MRQTPFTAILSPESNVPLIVVEIKENGFLLPYHKSQLLEYLNLTPAKFGMLYDGKKKLCYTKLNSSTIVEIVDIPLEKSLVRKIKKATDKDIIAD